MRLRELLEIPAHGGDPCVVKRKVKGGRAISLVKDPSYPFNLGYAVAEVKKGETIEVDVDRVVYDWTGKSYYRAVAPNGTIGYINTKAVEEV